MTEFDADTTCTDARVRSWMGNSKTLTHIKDGLLHFIYTNT